jgi:GntR family transcriptional regulator
MLISIHPSDDRPIYVQIMDEIRRARITGAVQPDEPLPSVRQLAAELRVNPMTVQQAYRELEREGLVYVRRGQGTFVSKMEVGEEERRTLARRVAERALRDAHRSGITVEELVTALRDLASGGGETRSTQPRGGSDAGGSEADP